MVVLSAPLTQALYMYLPLALLIAILYCNVLYLTHPAVTKATRSGKYKHAPNRWHGKKSLSMYVLVVKRKYTTLH